MTESIVVFLAAGFGLGWLPWAPGTFGALLGLPLAWWMSLNTLRIQVAFAAVLLPGGALLCHWASMWLGGGDASQIVADELLAFPIAVIGLAAARRPWLIAIAFSLYRLIDVTKPPPISYIEAIGGGWAIMLDDAAAAICTLIVLGAAIALLNRYRKTKKADRC